MMILRTSLVLICVLEYGMAETSLWGQNQGMDESVFSSNHYTQYSQPVHPADKPEFKIVAPVKAAIDPSVLNNRSTAALRGNVELIFLAEETEIIAEIMKRDLNVSQGEDSFSFTIFDAFDQPVVSHSIPGDGNATNNVVFGPIQNQQFTISLPATGIYTLRTTAGRDMYYDAAVSSRHSALRSTLEFIDGSRSIDLFFKAPPGEVAFNVSTIHNAGIPQTLRIHNSSGEVVERLFLNKLTTSFSLRADIPADEEGKVWRLHVPKQDLVLNSQQVDFWFRSAEEFFDFEFNQKLLQLRELKMAGIPGMRVPLRFEMENTGLEQVEVFPEFTHQSGFQLEFEEMPSSIAIDSGTQQNQIFYANIPQNTGPGDQANYVLNLNDRSGNPIISSKVDVRVVEQKQLDPSRQFLFFSPDELEEIRRLGREGEPYQQSIYNSIIRQADRYVEQNLPVPDEEAHWRGTYICDGIGDGDDDPNDGTGAPLIFDPLRPGEYICSVDGERYQGERYRRGWIGEYYFELFNRILRIGYAYNLEPKPEYAQYLRKTFLDIADRYQSYPLDDYQGNPSAWAARLMTETLGEAMGLTSILPAYDAVRASKHFSREDRAHIEWNFIRPAVKIIESNLMGITNWQSWHNTAIGLAGFLMDDQELIDSALHGENGHEFVKTVSIREDGIWQEGSVGYHFFGMVAMNHLLEAMDAHGLEPFDEKIELAYSSILDIMQPDGSFPALNDSPPDFIHFRASSFEIANGHYANPVFDQILTFIYETRGFGRGTAEALLFGKPYESTPFSIDSTIKPKMGLSTLRSGSGLEDQHTMMDYGPHGQFHGHFDKLHLSLYGAGENWLPDLGTGATNVPEFSGWFRNTIGHNTIIVNEQPQKIDTEETRDIRFYRNSFPAMQVMQAAFGAPVYPQGANVRRTVITSNDEYSIVIDDVSGARGAIDLVFHSSGWFDPSPGFEPLGGAPGWNNSSASGYQFLQPPIVEKEKAAEIMQYTTADGVHIVTQKEYGFTDDMESITEWSGNINLSDDATEGNTSLSWVVVPRDFQSVSKSFDTLNQKPVPDRITFDYKLEGNTFDFLTMQLTSLPDFAASGWIITSGTRAITNQWQQADLDLTQPDFVNGSGFQFSEIRFEVFNANQEEGAFKILIDNIQAWKGDTLIEPEERRIRFQFPGGQSTQYFLTDGPSIRPPRTHPVVLARRGNTQSTQHITVISPEEANEENEFMVQHIQPGELRFVGSVRDTVFEFNTETNRYALFSNGTITNELAAIGTLDFVHPESLIHYQSNHAADISIQWMVNVPNWVHYTKNNETNDTLVLRDMPFNSIEITLDDQPFFQFDMEINERGNVNLILKDLPQGEHQFTINSETSADVESWEVY